MYETTIYVYDEATNVANEVKVLVDYHFDRDETTGPCYFNLDGIYYADTKETVDLDILDEDALDEIENEIREYLTDYYNSY